MLPRSFEYVSPNSVDDVVALLGEHGEKAKLLAGGQSLIPLMKMRLAEPGIVIDLNRVPALAGIREEVNAFVVGALTRHREVERSSALREWFPVLGDAAGMLADPVVRNRGTVGGSLAHADPAADWATSFLTLGAEVEVRGPSGPRKFPIESLFKDSFATSLAPNELLVDVRLPKPPPHSGSAYAKLKRKTGDFATVAVAASVTLHGETVGSARLGLGGVAPTPMRAMKAEKALEGKKPDAGAIARSAEVASQEANPTADLRGSVEYKRAMVQVYVARALHKAVERAQGRKG